MKTVLLLQEALKPALRLLRRHTPLKLKEMMYNTLTSKDVSKTTVANSMALGALLAYVPIPGANFFTPFIVSKIPKTNLPVMLLVAQCSNIVTMPLQFYLVYKLGHFFFPENDFHAAAVGIPLNAVAAAALARQAMMLGYDKIKAPVRSALTWWTEDLPRPHIVMPELPRHKPVLMTFRG